MNSRTDSEEIEHHIVPRRYVGASNRLRWIRGLPLLKAVGEGAVLLASDRP